MFPLKITQIDNIEPLMFLSHFLKLEPSTRSQTGSVRADKLVLTKQELKEICVLWWVHPQNTQVPLWFVCGLGPPFCEVRNAQVRIPKPIQTTKWVPGN